MPLWLSKGPVLKDVEKANNDNIFHVFSTIPTEGFQNTTDCVWQEHHPKECNHPPWSSARFNSIFYLFFFFFSFLLSVFPPLLTQMTAFS